MCGSISSVIESPLWVELSLVVGEASACIVIGGVSVSEEAAASGRLSVLARVRRGLALHIGQKRGRFSMAPARDVSGDIDVTLRRRQSACFREGVRARAFG